MHSPLLISHRGDTNNFPENTVEAFRSAFDKGADGVEIDVQLIDGELTIVHDYLFARSVEYPTLPTVLERFAQKGRLEIEIKAFSTEILDPLKQLLEAYPTSDIELTTSEIPLVPYMVQSFPTMPIGVIFNSNHYQDWMTEELYVQKVLGHMKLLQAQVVHLAALPKEKLTTSLVQSLQSNGLVVHYHISRAEKETELALYKQLSKTGVDQCTFDDIELLEEVRK